MPLMAQSLRDDTSSSLSGGATCSSRKKGALEEFHASLFSPDVDMWRREALHSRQSDNFGLAYSCVGAKPAVTWVGLDRFIEIQVCMLRALLDGPLLWSPELQERVRKRVRDCRVSGMAALGLSGCIRREHGFVGGGNLRNEALAALSGYPGSASRTSAKGCCWVYRFSDPESAAAHLVSHPAFGAMEDAGARDIRVALSSCPWARDGSGCLALLVLLWQGSAVDPPLGEDLPVLLERCSANRAPLHRAIDDLAACCTPNGLLGAGQRLAEMPRLLCNVIDEIAAVWGVSPEQLSSLSSTGVPAQGIYCKVPDHSIHETKTNQPSPMLNLENRALQPECQVHDVPEVRCDLSSLIGHDANGRQWEREQPESNQRYDIDSGLSETLMDHGEWKFQMVMKGVAARALTRSLDAIDVRVRLDARREAPALLMEHGEHCRPIPLVDIQESLSGSAASSAAEKALNVILPLGEIAPEDMVTLLLTNGQCLALVLDEDGSAQEFADRLRMLCQDIKGF